MHACGHVVNTCDRLMPSNDFGQSPAVDSNARHRCAAILCLRVVITRHQYNFTLTHLDRLMDLVRSDGEILAARAYHSSERLLRLIALARVDLQLGFPATNVSTMACRTASLAGMLRAIL